MIVISVGLMKSGSGLYFNLANDLLIASGGADVRELKARFGLQEILKNYNCNVGAMNPDSLKPLLELHEKGLNFVIKTHAGPQPYIWEWMERGVIMATCIVRDPRDVVISAMNHGRRIIENGENHSFASCSTFEKAVPAVMDWMAQILLWLESAYRDRILYVRYETLIREPLQELQRLADYLRIRVSGDLLKRICSRYDPAGLSVMQKNFLHFDVGRAGRYRELPEPQAELLNREFAPYLLKLGYTMEEGGAGSHVI